MTEQLFETADGQPVSAVTAAEMEAVDRVATDELGLKLLQMMEHAGRALAASLAAVADRTTPITVLVGGGGNGGGGLAAARQLANHGYTVSVVLDRPPARLTGAPATQYDVVREMTVPTAVGLGGDVELSGVIADALVGYSLSGPLRGSAASIVDALPDVPVVSLDLPTGQDATTGATPGDAVEPDRVVTLALPKTGLAEPDCPIVLADIGIPGLVYDRLGIPYEPVFERRYEVELSVAGR